MSAEFNFRAVEFNSKNLKFNFANSEFNSTMPEFNSAVMATLMGMLPYVVGIKSSGGVSVV